MLPGDSSPARTIVVAGEFILISVRAISMTSCFFKQVLREKGVQQKATGAFDGAATDGNAPAGEGEHAGVRQGEEEGERCEETADEGGRTAGAMREMRIRVVSHIAENQKTKNTTFFPLWNFNDIIFLQTYSLNYLMESIINKLILKTQKMSGWLSL